MQVALQYIAKSLFDPRLVVPKVNPDMMLVASQSAAFLDREWTQQEWQDWMDRSWGEQVG